MAALTIDQWDVVILPDDRKLKRTYEMAPNTRLTQIMDIWKDDCQEKRDWIFISADRKDMYVEEFLTLEMVGETLANTGLVTLRVQLVSEEPKPTTHIFCCVKDDCHHLQVEPNQTLDDVLLQLRERPVETVCNGLSLDLKQTVSETKLDNYAVISEPCRQVNVSVKLSNGETMIFRIPNNSYVLQLINVVCTYEKKDFSLICQGRHLHPQERVKNLYQHLVEVARAEFNVNIDGRCISWTTGTEAVAFHNFLSQLAINGDLDERQLETMQFRCAGCERRISKSEGNPQLIPIECCTERSLTLIASSSADTKTQLELESLIHRIKSLYTYLEAFKEKHGIGTDGWRAQCREIDKDFLKHGLHYNTIIRMCEGLQSRIRKLNDKIESLEVKIEELTYENNMSEGMIQQLEEEKERLAKMIQTLALVGKEAVAVGTSNVPEAFIQNPSVKLLVRYHPGYFTPAAARAEVTEQGQYEWTDYCHLKCSMSELQAGWTSFEAVRDKLQSLFTKNKIRRIYQLHKEEKVEVTSLHDDEEQENWKDTEFSSDGQTTTWEEVGMPRMSQNILEGGQIFLCPGGRRNILGISSS